jgi:WD40 repeat protein
MAFSCNGKFIGTGATNHSYGGSASIWDVTTGKERHRFPLEGAHTARLWVAFTPNNKAFLTANFSLPVRMWDVESGKLLHTFGTEIWSAALQSQSGRAQHYRNGR